MSKQLRLDVAQLTDVGRKRPHNEDNMAYVIPLDQQVMAKKGALFIVADGMGGHAAGEVASEIAVDTVSKVYYQDDNEDVAVSLIQAIKRANALIHQRAAENMTRSGMGTTCVSTVLRGNMAYIANVGDSRAYMVHQSHAKQVSQDHSWVEEQVRAGLLTQEQARSHAQRNVITRSLGTQADVEIDMFIEPLEEGDTLVLCSDGLSGLITDEDLRSIVDQYQPQESVYRLIERANENGGPDNITAIVIRVQEVGVEPAGVRHPVPVGGGSREVANEDTAILNSQYPAASHPLLSRFDNGRTPSSSLRVNSGALAADGANAYQQMQRTRSRRGRLLYPAIAVLLLLLVALAGLGGLYFFNKNNSVDQTLASAKQNIANANSSLQKNDPIAALGYLSQAQKNFPKSSLSDAQAQQLNTLRKDLASSFRQAYATYDQQNSITDLSCANTKTTPATESAFSANLKGMAVVKNGAKEFFYTLGDDHSLYLFDPQLQHLSKITLKPDGYVEMIAGDNTRLIVLTSQADTQNPPRSYKLYVFQPDAQGNLATGPEADINKTLTTQGNFTPSALAAWGADIFIALVSKATPSNITILYYNLGTNNQFATPQQTNSSISSSANAIVSMVAFEKRQLFVLDNVGGIKSIQFVNAPSTQPSDVVLQGKMPSPLNINAPLYNAATPVPTPPTANVSTFLQLSGATGMAAGTLSDDGNPHLFILDGNSNRILELKVVPNIVASNVTPTPASNGGGGGAMASGLSMQLINQFASTSYLNNARSLAVDPVSTQNLLYVVTQDPQSLTQHSFVMINVRQTNGTCNG